MNVFKIGPNDAAKSSLEAAQKFRRAFKEPSQSAFMHERKLEHYDKVAILSCTIMVVTCSGDSKKLIVDMITYRTVQSEHAREFVGRLRRPDPFTFGLFSCKGVVRHTKA